MRVGDRSRRLRLRVLRWLRMGPRRQPFGIGRRRQRGRRLLHQLHVAADDQRHAEPHGFGMGTHRTGERALVGDGQRRIAQGLCTLDQLFGVRGTAQEAEVAAAKELGVTGE